MNGSNAREESMEVGSLIGADPAHLNVRGTKALMLAVLEDGIRSYLSHVPRIRSEAECWVRSRRQISPFSFSGVCDALGLEPDAVEAALRKMRDRKVSARRAIGRSRPNVRSTSRVTAPRRS